MDAFFLHDDQMNLANLTATLFFEKFEYESMKASIESKTNVLHKCRSKLHKSFGVWWWKEMPDEEWEQKKDAVCPLKKGIHTKEDLVAFMTQEQEIREPFDTV
jgi:hypothetical protein